MRSVFWLVAASLLLTTAPLIAQCVNGVCRPPARQAVVEWAWKFDESDPDKRNLFHREKIIGFWSVRDQLFRAGNGPPFGGSWTDPPIPIPAEFRQAVPQKTEDKPKTTTTQAETPPEKKDGLPGFMLNGVAETKISEREKHSINGVEVSATKAFIELGKQPVGSDLTDERQKPWLIISGPDPDQRHDVEQKIFSSPDFAPLKDKIRVWNGDGADPRNKIMRDRTTDQPIYPPGNPTILLTSASGDVLMHADKFVGSVTVGALRKAMPDYDPKKDPTPDVEPKKPLAPESPIGDWLNKNAGFITVDLAAMALLFLLASRASS